MKKKKFQVWWTQLFFLVLFFLLLRLLDIQFDCWQFKSAHKKSFRFSFVFLCPQFILYLIFESFFWRFFFCEMKGKKKSWLSGWNRKMRTRIKNYCLIFWEVFRFEFFKIFIFKRNFFWMIFGAFFGKLNFWIFQMFRIFFQTLTFF